MRPVRWRGINQTDQVQGIDAGHAKDSGGSGERNLRLHFNQVTIIGVGLIGGSLGMILRRKGLASRIIGVGRRIENLKTAVELGAIDRYVVDPKGGGKDTDLVVLDTPVDTYEPHFNEVAAC